MNSVDWQTGSKLIFWADDDADDLEVFREVVNELSPDYTLVEFGNGQELLDHLKSLPKAQYPCLIVLDMNMPVLTGKDTLRLLKADAAYGAIPVVVFTTSSSELDKLFCERHGTEMVTKPPSYTLLRKILPRLLSRCSMLSYLLLDDFTGVMGI